MSPNSIQRKIKSLLDLIRFDKPIGFALLMWPCWFALASLPLPLFDNLKWYIFFLVGSFLMRSAGCIINDLVDIKLDKEVERTSQRPLVIKSVKISEAIIFLFLLLTLSLFILLQFNLNSIIIGLLSVPFVILYPYMKRFTYWPQLVLGIIFNWGVLIVSMQFNGYISISSLILYLGCIFWTLGYDTIYAYQDLEDDINNNIKSTAVLFGDNGKKFVFLFYIIFLIILGYTGFQSSDSITSVFVLILILIAMMFFLNKWDVKLKSSSNKYFKINNFFGFLCFIYLMIF